MADHKIQVAKVAFKGNTEKLYSYLTLAEHKIVAGNIAICERGDAEPIIGKVVSVSDDFDPVATAWIIGKADAAIADFKKAQPKLNKLVAEEKTRREQEALDDLLG